MSSKNRPTTALERSLRAKKRKPKENAAVATCRTCGEDYPTLQKNSTMCAPCRDPKPCRCGCGKTVSSPGIFYFVGHNPNRNQNISATYKRKEALGEQHHSKQPEVRAAMSAAHRTPAMVEWHKNHFQKMQNRLRTDEAKKKRLDTIQINQSMAWGEARKQQQAQKMLQKGESHASKRQDVKKKISESHKALGENHWTKKPEVRAKMSRAYKGRKIQQTKPERKLIDALDASIFKYTGCGRNPYGTPISADITAPSLRMIIQVDGCYWHGCQMHAKVSRFERREADRRLTCIAEKEGWVVLRFWEHEIKDEFPSVLTRIEEVCKSRQDTLGKVDQ